MAMRRLLHAGAVAFTITPMPPKSRQAWTMTRPRFGPRPNCWPLRSRTHPTSRLVQPTSTATPTTRCSASWRKRSTESHWPVVSRTVCSDRWASRRPCSPPAPRTPSPIPTRTATCTAAPPLLWWTSRTRPTSRPRPGPEPSSPTTAPARTLPMPRRPGRHLHSQQSRHLDPGTGRRQGAQRGLSAPVA